MRKTLIAGNWKMHTTGEDAVELATKVAKASKAFEDREVLVAPPYTNLRKVAGVVSDSPVKVAVQNICWEKQGAFTGEISPEMVKAAGGVAAIVGHSERRQLFGETDELINKRLLGALNNQLLTILCIGETLEEREADKTFNVLEEQVTKGLEGVTVEQMAEVVIAYEPVWAIGTGRTATKEQAQEAHAFIRALIEKLYEKNIAEQIRILYGGSVKPSNVDELMAQPDIDGALVGGAALDAESFERIIQYQ